jgi:hypothetical protein
MMCSYLIWRWMLHPTVYHPSWVGLCQKCLMNRTLLSPLGRQWQPLTDTAQKYSNIAIPFTYRQNKQLPEASSPQSFSFEHFDCSIWLRLYLTCHELNVCSSEFTGSRKISPVFSSVSITLCKTHLLRLCTFSTCANCIRHHNGIIT